MAAVLKTTLAALAITLAVSVPAAARNGSYTRCPAAGDATIVKVSRAGCEEAGAVAAALAAAPERDDAAILRAAGWAPLHAGPVEGAGTYDLVATRGRAALRIRRPGEAPDLDGWAAGRELLFSRRTLVGGRRAPSDAVLCTSAFLVRLGSHTGGLSAAHCAGLRRDGTTHRRNAALRRPPQPGIVLGRVQRNLERRRLDALVLPVPSGAGRPSASVVERGVGRPPWFVAGTARPLLGRRVCFAGRTSGHDRCGRIVRSYPGTRLPCTTITAREGDSGGPVYTRPRSNGTVYAVGITTLVFGLLQKMCFTPLKPVLKALRGRLVTAGGR